MIPVLKYSAEPAENEDDANIDFGELYWKKTCGRHWHCPWGSTIVDEVAPGFKLILEDSYLSSSAFPSEDNQRTRSLWWMYRKKLDHCLGELLR